MKPLATMIEEAERRKMARETAVGAVRRIVAEVCAKYNLGPLDLVSERRSRRIAWPRQEAMWRASKETTASLPLIGRELGNRDHSTVIHGIRRHEQRIKAGALDGTTG